MDSPRDDLTSPPTSVPAVPEISQAQESDITPSTLETLPTAIPSSDEPIPSLEQPEMPSESQPRAPTPPPIEPVGSPAEEVEHAYWAEFGEDSSTPDADEMKEINGSDQDYSACDRRFHPKFEGR
jgi:hypothetical protein